jgi:hypothetical protein
MRGHRRTKAEMQAIRDGLIEIMAGQHPMTVRQVFYGATVRGLVEKTESQYKGTVCRLLAEMRRAGEIPYRWIADATRWMRKPTTWSSAEEALRNTAETYRRALWDESSVAVEVWCEKEALAGVLVETTDEWDVPLMVTRGYPSISYMHSAAQAIAARYERNQRTRIYYFGDNDPSGRDIDRVIVEGIGESLAAIRGWSGLADPEEAFDIFADFERVAVTEEQIEEWELPTRPTKKTDTRAANFEGESVELDAIEAPTLRQLVREAIELHVDPHELGVLHAQEAEERRLMLEMADRGLMGLDPQGVEE